MGKAQYVKFQLCKETIKQQQIVKSRSPSKHRAEKTTKKEKKNTHVIYLGWIVWVGRPGTRFLRLTEMK